jgi:transcriptional regulator with XRE-family HTH domain
MKTERLEEIRLELGLTKTEMAGMMGISPHYYYNIFNPKSTSSLRMEHLESLMEKAGVNPVWVLTGEGEKYLHQLDVMLAEGEPTDEEVEALYHYVMEKWPRELTLEQVYAVKLACAHVFVEYPDIKSLDLLAMAAGTYMKVIVRIPDINLTNMLGLPDDIEEVIAGNKSGPNRL